MSTVIEKGRTRISVDYNGNSIIWYPSSAETSSRNCEVNLQLHLWAKKNGKGKTFINTGFKLRNKTNISAKCSWILKERYNALTQKQREGFPPIAPDFVVELRSKSDRLKPIQDKMAEFIENGVRLGWLIDPYKKQVHIYRKNGEIEILENPKTVSGEDVLEGFELDLEEIL